MIVAALCLFLLAGIIGWLAGDGAARHPAVPSAASWLCGAAGSALLVVAGAWGLAGHAWRLPLGAIGGFGGVGLDIDRLSGLFLVITFGAAGLAMLAGMAAPGRPRLPAAAALVAASCAVIILAQDLFLLLAGWEALGFAFYLTVGFDRDRAGCGRASVLATGFSKVSGGLILVGGGMLAVQSGDVSWASFGGHPGPISSLGYALLVAGFAVKVGLLPFHVWLPPAYAAAAGPVRALLAGAAVNVGFYGMWRTLDALGEPPVWLACAVLLVAGLSAVLGIGHAAVHADLRGMVAWSSVENAGVITAGYGVALTGAAIGDPQLTAAGLLAGTLQMIAHAAAKTLLFVATTAVESDAATTDLDRLRGLARRLPVTGAALSIGALTLAGMPLTAGFASEWLTLEALMQQFRVHELALQLCMAAAGILVALTIGVAGVAFVRLIGLTAFGHGGRVPAATRVERSWAQRVSAVALGLVCVGAAAFAPFVVAVVAAGLSPIVGEAAFGALAGAWILQPVFPGFSALSPTLLWIAIPAYAALTVLLAGLFSGGRLLRVRRVPPWRSASVGVPGRAGYTSYAFANPIRRVLAGVLGTRREVRPHRESTTADGGVGDDVGSAPPLAPVQRLDYRVDVTDVFQRYLYRPLIPLTYAAVRAARRLQSGRLDAYMAYMLVALLALIAVVTALA